MTTLTTVLSPWQVDDLPPRLAARVTVDPASGCWRVTTGYHDDDGYTYYAGEGAHRVAYKHLVGPVPASRPVIDHVLANGCAWRDCVNVNGHLEAVTIRENTMRGTSFAALNALKTHCGKCGRPYDEANTYIRPDTGGRGCRNCNRTAVARYTERQRLADAWNALLDFGRAA